MAATSPEATFRPALRKGPRFDPSAARRPILVFEDVYKCYRADQPVLRGMTKTTGCGGFFKRADCWPCMREDGFLTKVIGAIEERTKK